MTKVVINQCWGGFSVSEAVYDELGFEWDGHGCLYNTPLNEKYGHSDELRADPDLIAAIEKVGCAAASNYLSSLVIVDIPDGIGWEIDDYDGMEAVWLTA